jgi:hypothetical protein
LICCLLMEQIPPNNLFYHVNYRNNFNQLKIKKEKQQRKKKVTFRNDKFIRNICKYLMVDIHLRDGVEVDSSLGLALCLVPVRPSFGSSFIIPTSDHGVESPKFIWALVYSCTHWLRPHNPSPPTPRVWAHLRGRYWSAKIDDVSL